MSPIKPNNSRKPLSLNHALTKKRQTECKYNSSKKRSTVSFAKNDLSLLSEKAKTQEVFWSILQPLKLCNNLGKLNKAVPDRLIYQRNKSHIFIHIHWNGKKYLSI